jgi:hypothetical protein
MAIRRREATRRFIGLTLPDSVIDAVFREAHRRQVGVDEAFERAITEGWLAPPTILAEPLPAGAPGGRR